jgi:hypothetical protein
MNRKILKPCSSLITILSIGIIFSCTTQKQKPFPIYKPADSYQTFNCTENTQKSFNINGIKVLPFIRTAFADMDGDGFTDLIAGSKYGTILLYISEQGSGARHWKSRKRYFEGIHAGAFSTPSIGDIDGDGRLEVAIGTGGFSSESGRILFYRNAGTKSAPVWTSIHDIDINIGDDASVALVDYDFDQKTDIIAGNSEGNLFFFKNVSSGNHIRFRRDKRHIRRSFGMYAAPAAVRFNNRVIVAVGNSLGRLFLYELKKKGGRVSVRKLRHKFSVQSFAAPSFVDLVEKGRFDLVVSDSDGNLTYFENRKHDFTLWKKNDKLFNERIFAGPASAPTLAHVRGRTFLVIGNIDGTLKLYEHAGETEDIPWIEKGHYLKDIRVSGFSRGILTQWEGRELIITGQSSGELKAFFNTGSSASPEWMEEADFFRNIRVTGHSTPTVFDIDGDGTWELVTGAADGKVYAYRIVGKKEGVPLWERVRGVFDDMAVEGFSAPAMMHDMDTMYIFIGQQDGTITTYTTRLDGSYKSSRNFYEAINKMKFREVELLNNFKMSGHSSPSVTFTKGAMEFIAGDYDGNIRHFFCERGVQSGEQENKL